jgi:hypothetical protein
MIHDAPSRTDTKGRRAKYCAAASGGQPTVLFIFFDSERSADFDPRSDRCYRGESPHLSRTRPFPPHSAFGHDSCSSVEYAVFLSLLVVRIGFPYETMRMIRRSDRPRERRFDVLFPLALKVSRVRGNKRLPSSDAWKAFLTPWLSFSSGKMVRSLRETYHPTVPGW